MKSLMKKLLNRIFSVKREYNERNHEIIFTHTVYKFLFLKIKLRYRYPAVVVTPPPESVILYYTALILNIFANVKDLKVKSFCS